MPKILWNFRQLSRVSHQGCFMEEGIMSVKFVKRMLYILIQILIWMLHLNDHKADKGHCTPILHHNTEPVHDMSPNECKNVMLSPLLMRFPFMLSSILNF